MTDDRYAESQKRFIEHMKKAAGTIGRWPKWKRDVAARVLLPAAE